MVWGCVWGMARASDNLEKQQTMLKNDDIVFTPLKI